MAQIPQISNPITAKNYNYSSRPTDENTEPFDIVQLTGVGGAGGSGNAGSRAQLEMGNRELIPLASQIAKDPTLAVETLKDLLNIEVLNQALITGHTELYGKLEDLAAQLYVTPEELVQEIQNQEQQNTMFSGHEFYDVLRDVAKTTTDQGTKEIIGNLLKSLNFAQNKNEILGALRANLKFLSEYYSPNEKLSAKLLNLSQQWGADDAENYFDYLKTQTLAILKDVSGSLLNDDKTQMLIPLITHNLSRYNNSKYMSKEYFNLLLTQISSSTLRESLKNSFNRLYSAIFNKSDMQNPQSPQQSANKPATGGTVQQPDTPTMAQQPSAKGDLPEGHVKRPIVYSDLPDTQGEQPVISNKAPATQATQNEQPDINGRPVISQGEQPVPDMLSGDKAVTDTADIQNPPQQPSDAAAQDASKQVKATADPITAQNPQSAQNTSAENTEPLDNYTTNLSQNQPLKGNLNNKNSLFEGPENNIQHIDETNPESFVENNQEIEEPIPSYGKHLNEIMSEKGYMQALKSSGYNIEKLLSAYSRGKTTGFDTLQNLVKGLFIDNDSQPFEAEVLADFSKLNTMQEVIDQLNVVLRSMPDIPLRERLYGAFVDTVDKMSLKNEMPQHGVRPPVSSTLDSLTEFIEENINHPALKSLDSFNAANLLQSLLNAPGVFTPLAHYILPLDVNGTKAFGELWVDNDENNPNNTPETQRNYHLFLTFDVESIGRFELDMYALGEDVNIALLYPPRFDKQIDPMKERITKIIRNTGYHARTFETAPLKKAHNLTEIFPKIIDKRTTLNTRI